MTWPSLTVRVALAFAAYLGVGAVHLVALWLDDAALSGATKPWLMPALLLALVVAAPRWWSPLTLWGGLALVFSWLGDTSLMYDDELGFLSGLGFFLVAHLCYLVLIVRLLRRRPVPFVALTYVGWLVALVALLAPHTGWMVWPLVAYGLVLGAVAASALAAGPWVASGAALFLISDTILGLNKFMPHLHIGQVHFLIMLSYIAGQGLIIYGAVRAARRGMLRQPVERLGKSEALAA